MKIDIKMKRIQAIICFFILGKNLYKIVESADAPINLPDLSDYINRDTISVSGFSSGGCFSTQFHFAYSKTINGAGIFSGCPYLYGDIELAKNFSSYGLIDDLKNIDRNTSRVYIFQGIVDPIVPWPQGRRVHNMYKTVMKDEKIQEISNFTATHGVPSSTFGAKCWLPNPPLWINNCNYCGADAVIRWLLDFMAVDPYDSSSNIRALKPDNELENSHEPTDMLYLYNQNEFYNDAPTNYSMDEYGYLYVPKQCLSDDAKNCHLHIYFHGCGLGRYYVEDSFIQNSSFLETADRYGIIVLFPQVVPIESNDSGCWDWWGYLSDSSDARFATKDGLQMSGIAGMIERIAGVKMS